MKQATRLEEAAASRAADKAASAQAVEQLRAQLDAEAAKAAGNRSIIPEHRKDVNFDLNPIHTPTLSPNSKCYLSHKPAKMWLEHNSPHIAA